MHRHLIVIFLAFAAWSSPGLSQETSREKPVERSGNGSPDEVLVHALDQVSKGHTDRAIVILEKAAGNHPDDARIKRLLASQYYEAGDYIKAREAFSGLVASDSTDVASWLKLAEIASFRQQYGEAVTILDHILELDSTNLSSLMMMGEILNRLDNTGAAIYYERARRLYPGNQKVAFALANWYIQAKSPDKSIPLCETILSGDTANIKFTKLLGYAYYKLGSPAPAISSLTRAAILGDSTFFTFKFLGISQFLAVDHSGAIRSLQLATEKDSADAEVHFFLGASLGTTTRKQEAMYHLDRSLELMQPDPAVVARIYSEKGNILRLERQYERAYQTYQKAWLADTTNPMPLYYKASIMDNSLHRSREALRDYQAFINRLDNLPESKKRNNQMPTIRQIVENRIVDLKEELFFLDAQN